jgi:outer membrane protein OmpA-like peptidoglycan-associated protein
LSANTFEDGTMTVTTRVLASAAAVVFAVATPLSAQSEAPRETRPATTTFLGDTGLWFVPTGEVLPAGTFSVSGYRANFDRSPGSTDISHFAATLGYGVADRVELFGSFRFLTRIDRDTRPLFGPGASGGPVGEFPLIRDGWASAVGDLVIGAKFNVLAPWRNEGLGPALAFRAGAKLPSGDDDEGTSSGKPDFFLDAIVSKEFNERLELAGTVGFGVRGKPEDVEVGGATFRYGLGIGVPTRSPLRLTAELHGEVLTDTDITLRNPQFFGFDGSQQPSVSTADKPVDLAFGATWLSARGFFAGAGVNFALNTGGDVGAGSKTGFQFRLGYHPGVRVYAPPPPPLPPQPLPVNRPPTVKARCEPCTIEIGKTSTITADAQDPDGDPLTYRWSAPTGSIANPADRQTIFTAPMVEGPVPVTVTVDDGKSGTATDTITIQVVRPAVKEFVFEDVHFDFDRYTLRPEALRVLDEAVAALQDSTTLRLELEGHTCNIGTAEYNLALGERRAHAVRDYLVSRGVSVERLRTVSYGEERPKHDNAREETRRLNRRAALVVRVQ